MKKSIFAALALAAIAFTASATTAQASNELQINKARETQTFSAIHYVETVARIRVVSPLQLLAAEEAAAQALPVVELLQADQYALRQIDRQRPLVTPGWREAPSV